MSKSKEAMGNDNFANESFAIAGTSYIVQFVTDYVRDFEFPEELADEKFKLKDDEFHVSLIKLLPEIDEQIRTRIDQASVEAGEKLLANPPRLTGEFRLAKKDDRETIVGLVESAAIEEWRDALRKIVPDLQFTVPHTTLYTTDGKGIGLNSDFEYAERVADLDSRIENILREKIVQEQI